MTELPKGWAETLLGNLGRSIKGSLLPAPSETYELYSVPSFPSGEPETLSGSDIGSHKRPVAPSDLLICKINPRINRVWWVRPRREHRQIASPEWLVLRTPEPRLMEFLRHQLSGPDFRRWIEQGVHGVTGSHTRAKDDHVLGFRARVPPLAEQGRIVAAIEEAFSKLDAAEAGLRTVRQLLKLMRDAVLAAAVTGRLVPQDPTDTPAKNLLADLGVEPIEPDDVPALPDGWAWAFLGDVADIVGGVTKDAKRQDDPSFVERPYLRVANVQRGYLDLDVITSIRVAPEKAAKLELKPGDVLFNEGGDRDKLGRGWVWEGQVADCIHQNHVFRARLPDGIEPKLVSIWGNTFGQGWFEGRGKQTTNLASINLRTLKTFPIPVAPVGEQSRVLAEVDRQLSDLEACERAIDAGLTRSAALRRSILKAAFKGKLVSQDPSDEPASELLERIRAERATAPRPARRTRKSA